MVFQCINIHQVPWEVLKTAAFGLGFHHLPRDLANVNAWKTMFDPYIVILQMGLDGQVKLMDVGVAKPTNLLTDTLIGSPAYMAPEVVLSSGYQDNSVDIYSVSFILWEMWYGSDVANIINKEVLGIGCCGDAMSLFKARQAKDDGGFRPSLTMANKPPEKLINILKASWSADPKRRPSAVQLHEFFKTFLETSTY